MKSKNRKACNSFYLPRLLYANIIEVFNYC